MQEVKDIIVFQISRCASYDYNGSLYSVEWNGGMEQWNGIVEGPRSQVAR